MNETGKDLRAWINKTIKGWETQTRADIPDKLKEAYREDIQFLLGIKEIIEVWYKYNLWDLRVGIIEK